MDVRCSTGWSRRSSARSCGCCSGPGPRAPSNVPRTGPAILASNHLSFSDHFFAPLPLPRKVVFLAKSEYFTGRGIKGLFSKAFFSGVGQIPVDRSGGEASERALRDRPAGAGRRPPARHLPGGHPDAGRPAVPRQDRRRPAGAGGAGAGDPRARWSGGFEFQPPGQDHAAAADPAGVRFGKPLDFSRYYGLENDRIVLRAVTDEIIYEIMKLSGQEYVDEYAQRLKVGMPLPRRSHGRQAAGQDGAADGRGRHRERRRHRERGRRRNRGRDKERGRSQGRGEHRRERRVGQRRPGRARGRLTQDRGKSLSCCAPRSPTGSPSPPRSSGRRWPASPAAGSPRPSRRAGDSG